MSSSPMRSQTARGRRSAPNSTQPISRATTPHTIAMPPAERIRIRVAAVPRARRQRRTNSQVPQAATPMLAMASVQSSASEKAGRSNGAHQPTPETWVS